MKDRNLATKNNSHPWFTFHDQFSDLINRFNEELGPYPEQTSISHFVPKVDIHDLDDKYLVTAEIPGMNEKEINIDLVGNVLILEGEKKSEFKNGKSRLGRSEISYGKFYRTIPLHENVDEEKCEAKYKDGLLKVTLVKKPESRKQTKRIAVNQNKVVEEPRH